MRHRKIQPLAKVTQVVGSSSGYEHSHSGSRVHAPHHSTDLPLQFVLQFFSKYTIHLKQTQLFHSHIMDVANSSKKVLCTFSQMVKKKKKKCPSFLIHDPMGTTLGREPQNFDSLENIPEPEAQRRCPRFPHSLALTIFPAARAESV